MSITVTPASTVNLVKVPLENDYKNTFTFSSLTAQTNYFNGLSSRIIAGTDYTYIKKDNKIRVGLPIDDIINYNYLFYTNNGFPKAKRYYCFITNMEYINENCTDIYIETDVFQTWYFQLTWNRCFVEREHVNNDGIGVHTFPEGLELGESVNNGVTYLIPESNNTYICIASTYQPPALERQEAFQPYYNGIFSGSYLYVFNDSKYASLFIKMLDDYGKGDAITSVFLIPQDLLYLNGHFPTFEVKTYQGKTRSFTMAVNYVENSSLAHNMNIASDGTTLDINVYMPGTLNGYSPRNNKLFVYPYNYIYVTNNVGNDVIYNYEDFTNNVGKFRTYGSLTPGCSIKCYPLNYKNIADNDATVLGSNFSYAYGISQAKYPVCSWQNDVYTNWITQNGVNIQASVAAGIGEMFVGAMFAEAGMGTSAASSIIGGVNTIHQTIGEVTKHSKIPPASSGNLNSGDVTFSSHKMSVEAHKMSVRYEIAQKIDQYFDMFGYKICNVKVPNITGRQNWNYIKTIDCNVDGDLPQEDLNTIKDACNRGITFWHNPANIYNYSLSNNII